jgi:hypothetical protein
MGIVHPVCGHLGTVYLELSDIMREKGALDEQERLLV